MAESRNVIRSRGATFVVHSAYGARFNKAWFEPSYWGGQATSVSSGGRGSAWFIESPDVSGVLRHYLRGGLIARLFRASYVFLGERKVRSFAEFDILSYLHRTGFPVPRPVAACYRKTSVLFYSASIIVERLNGAYPMADLVCSLSLKDWHNLGVTLRQFHDAGVMHADLNCFNILVREGWFYLIDFDKGVVKAKSRVDAPWKQLNLDRLHRSLKRLEWGLADVTLEQGWSALYAGYQDSK